MPAQTVLLDAFFPVPRERVFAFFADHEKFGRIWGGRFRRIKDGKDPNDVNGLGSVREICTAGLTFEETIVTYRPPALIEYTITRGGPIRNHLGHIEFHEEKGGTRVAYRIAFDPKVPLTGGIVAAVLRSGWRKGARKAVKELGGTP